MANPLPDPRRVVTAHNAEGRAVVQSDAGVPSEAFPGKDTLRSGALWVTRAVPTDDCNSEEDGATRKIEGLGIAEPKGTNFRYTDLAPGSATPMHRTCSVDYNILIQGELVLVLDDGSQTHLRAPGDTVIQRGTIHEWRNPGTEWARWATVIVGAAPAAVGGKTLGEEVVWESAPAEGSK